MSAENDEATLVRFLLEDLPETERADLEDRYFTDDELFARLLAVEGELIEDYLSSRLSEEDRRRFETVFLRSPDRRRRFELSRRLLRSLEHRDGKLITPPPKRALRVGPGRQAVALAAGLVLILLSLLAGDDLRVRRELGRTREQFAAAQERAQELQRQLSALQPPTPSPGPPGAAGPRLLALNLRAELPRNPGGGSDLTIGPDVSAIRATLEPPTVRYPEYHASLRTAEGRLVWKGDLPAGRDPQADPLVVVIPARLLAAGDYVLALEGVTAAGSTEAAAEYFFRVLPPSSR